MRHSLARAAVLLAGAVALVGPAAAEWSALQRLRAGLERCPSPTGSRCGGLARADIDLGGLRLWHPWREQAGLRAEAGLVAVSADLGGLTVDAFDLQVARVLDHAPDGAPAAASIDADAPPAPAPAAAARNPLYTRGIPVHLRVHGPARWSQGDTTLTLDEPELMLDGHGGATATFGLAAQGPGLELVGAERWTARVASNDHRRWHAEGTLALAGGPSAHAAITVSTDGVELRLDDLGGGTLHARAPLPRNGMRRPDTLALDAHGFSLATLGSTGSRTLAGWGVDPHRAVVDATVRVDAPTRAGEGSIDIEHLRLRGLVVDQRKLARTPLHVDGLELHGALDWRGNDLHGDLWLAHREAEVRVSLRLDEDALELHTALAPLPCQALIGSLPDAMADMVTGTQLAGQLEAHADLRVDRRELAAARGDQGRPHDAPPPGTLEISMPFLERCTIVQDDPRLDLSALSGPYRHRFVDASGRHQVRLMAQGGPGYVALEEVPLLARAFVTLEDRRFWSHDGFDREQIVNAFWHNLIEGRVRRGASTISQQAARNLWLGVDRSWGRKLQEALLTVRLESSTSKERIMELYLNVIELGPGVHGVDDAARFYFGRGATELSVLQVVHLASLAPAPSRFAAELVDGRVSDAWLARLHDQVRRMYRAGFITRAQMVAALRDDLGLLDRRGDAVGS